MIKSRAIGLLLAVVALAVVVLAPSVNVRSFPVSATLSEIEGDVQVQLPGKAWTPAKNGMLLPVGASIKTGSKSSAVVKWSSGNVVKLTPFTNFAIKKLDIDPRTKTVVSDLDMSSGKIKFKAEKLQGANSGFKVTTPVAVAGVRGTTGDIENTPDNVTQVTGRTGLICVESNGSEVCVEGNQQTNVNPGGPPSPPKNVTEEEKNKCTADQDCMSGRCVDGKCASEDVSFQSAAACFPVGEACDESKPCCSGACVDGLCKVQTAANPPKNDNNQGQGDENLAASKPAAVICSINSPAEGQKIPLSQGTVRVAGTAAAGAVCDVNGTSVTASSAGAFTADLPVDVEGDFEINVKCGEEAQGIALCGTKTVVAGAPTLRIFDPVDGFKKCPDMNITGTTDAGVRLTVNDVSILELKGATQRDDGSFEIPNFNPPNCNDSLRFTAEDSFGQKTYVVVTSGVLCGDGVVSGAEKCDSGTNNTDTACEASYAGSCTYCDTKCTPHTVVGASCGDGTKNSEEACDAGANNTDTACTAAYGATCTYCNTKCEEQTVSGGSCGDGTKNGEEACDAGANNTDTACTAEYGSSCTYCDTTCASHTVAGASCGDGTCDTGETASTCSADCESCGNGDVEGTERCDMGAENTDTACVAEYGSSCTYCNTSCNLMVVTGASCGDATCDSGNEDAATCYADCGACGNGDIEGPETCDMGVENTDTACVAEYGSNCTYCDKTCVSHTVEGAVCGDGTCNSGNEDAATCYADCGSCGNAAQEGEEGCDYGVENTDTPCTPAYGSSCTYCDTSCVSHTVEGGVCGDATCDDGSEDAATCYIDCGACGNGIQEGEEGCDRGAENTNTVCTAPYGGSCDYCTTDCVLEYVTGEYCGDGSVNGSEGCDSGAYNNVPCSPGYNYEPNVSTCSYCNSECTETTLTNTYCGDGICDELNENAGTCYTDCGVCGNNVKESDEQCDDGSSNTETPCIAEYSATCNYCNLDCVTQIVTGSYCGDSVCDSGYEDANSCYADCGVCGNEIVEGAEGCDLGTNNGVSCTPEYNSSCVYCDSQCVEQTVNSTEYCGDGTTNGPEYCDDGASNTVTPCAAPYNGSCTYCDTSCYIQSVQGAICGDATCDSGYEDASTCYADCGSCGDGSTDGPEMCDDGAGNTETPCTASYNGSCTYCDTSCYSHSVQGAVCGDATCDSGYEDASTCYADCGSCGDGSTDGPEMCDDGAGNTDTPCVPEYDSSCTYCNTSCVSNMIAGAYCGDGNVDSAGGETCDAGGDNGASSCYLATCGGTCETCGADCLTQQWQSYGCCGDSYCDASYEDLSTCPVDCAVCGDGICTDGVEGLESCTADCTVCGDSYCTGEEDPDTCYSDCGSCGDQICTAGSEDPDSCYSDCGSCGDAYCSAGYEDLYECPVDCAVCGDAICSETENMDSCYEDCGRCGDETCTAGYEDVSTCFLDCGSCGDTVCSSGYEDAYSCYDDCGSCGDGSCNPDFETDTSCPADCNGTDVCGDSSCTGNETLANCAVDCYVCGDEVCTSSYEDPDSCYSDCGSCGDGYCSYMYEDSQSCSQDCIGGMY